MYRRDIIFMFWGCGTKNQDLFEENMQLLNEVGFLLLRLSVVYTVESLSLIYLLFISRFVFTRR